VVVIRFVDIGGIVDHHCLGVVVIRFGDIGGIVDHHCLEVVVQQNELQSPLNRDGQQFYQYQFSGL
jgi:hypothetical protein